MDFTEHSTTHGLYYACEREAKLVSHLFWLLICLVLFSLAVYLIVKQYVAWKDDPVLTTVSTTGHPVSNITFPAITICSLGLVEDVMHQAFKYDKPNKQSSVLYFSSSTVSVIINVVENKVEHFTTDDVTPMNQ